MKRKEEGPFPCLPQKSCSSPHPLLLQGDPKVSKGRPESPLVASAEAKPSSKEGPFPCLPQKSCSFCLPFAARGPEGFQRAIGKPFGRLRRGETLCETEKSKGALFLAFHKESVSCGRFRPPAGGRGTFHHWKVPKGCRGRPKGACLMAAPGPPVAKQQCTASLAGARPAGFTSVPGRATVAFGAADPSPGVYGAGLSLESSARDRCGRNTLLRYVPRLRCRAKCVPAAAPDWLRAPGQTKWRARYGPCRSRDKRTYPFRDKGGPGVSLGRLKGV